jgi:chemotaxis signal transduction protein
MFTNTVSNKWTEITEPLELTVELIVFDIGEVSFGISIDKIDRVINTNQLDEELNIGQNIEIIDLHHRLFGTSISIPTTMVIFRGDKMYGIAIDTTPTLTIVPLDRIRILPSEFRMNSPLDIASHIAMISTSTAESTIFILGS